MAQRVLRLSHFIPGQLAGKPRRKKFCTRVCTCGASHSLKASWCKTGTCFCVRSGPTCGARRPSGILSQSSSPSTPMSPASGHRHHVCGVDKKGLSARGFPGRRLEHYPSLPFRSGLPTSWHGNYAWDRMFEQSRLSTHRDDAGVEQADPFGPMSMELATRDLSR